MVIHLFPSNLNNIVLRKEHYPSKRVTPPWKAFSQILLVSIALFLLLFSPSVAVDTIAANQVIKDGDTIVSAGEMYELGFFSPANSNNRYLGIWFKKFATGTVVWVANRDLPLSNTSGTFKVSSEGLLLLSCCGDTVIWSSPSSTFDRYINPVAQLLDNGNFVIKDVNSTDDTNLIWQSFDYPGDTLLPGMKFGKDFVTGTNRNLTSWKSPNDPSIGQYVNYVDTNGYRPTPPFYIPSEGAFEKSKSELVQYLGMLFRHDISLALNDQIC